MLPVVRGVVDLVHDGEREVGCFRQGGPTLGGYDIIVVMSPERGHAIYALLRHVRPIVLNSARVVEAQVRAVGWTVGTRAVVEVLAEHGPAPVPRIASALDLPRQAVQRHVDDLLELGHVETRPNPEHRRSRLIAVTSQGQEAFDHVRATELTDLRHLAADCTDDEVDAAIRVLAALDRDIRERAAHRRGGQRT